MAEVSVRRIPHIVLFEIPLIQLYATTKMDPSNSTNSNILIVLCGLVGSGKSTFATALQREFPEVRRCNQDELGRREDVEREVHAALSQGLSVCVDRTNFDPGQRRTWIDIARQHSNIEIWGITMDTPFDVGVCYSNNTRRAVGTDMSAMAIRPVTRG
ncbi:KTI12 domain-containing protein [Rhizoctonia solani AG-1 IA]|uniref:KTI12 domain-containing protein n=1 Tax=Thanatephorus cucumeris (strain AG1-IA) TaxID=983506 RepID=L8X559_THACA|nr:KTI12 domain-containing protein [Rhizoctonia solani AG-1 IA]